MEDLDNETIEELKAKAIERGGEEVETITTNEIDEELKDSESHTVVEELLPQEVKKPKRQRSEKQKAAFEKARLKRAENLKIKKEIEAEKKQKQKEEKEQVKIEVKKRLQKNKDRAVSQALDRQPKIELQKTETPLHNPTRPKDISRFKNDLYDESPNHRYKEQVVNNYYYYGTPPPQEAAAQEPRAGHQRRKKKIVKEPEPEPYYSSSESEEEEEEIIYSDPDEPQSYKELQNFQEEPPRPQQSQNSNGLKFRFA